MAFLRATTGLNVGDLSELRPGSLIIGRNPKRCDVILDHSAVSREHACIEYVEGVAYVEDLYSRNGVTVNGRLLQPGPAGRMRLSPRDRIKIASYEFVYEEDPEAAICVAKRDAARPEFLSTVNMSMDSSHLDTRFTSEGKLETILGIIEELSNDLDIDGVLPKIVDSLFRVFTLAETGFILLRDASSGKFEPAAFRSRSGKDKEARISRTLIDRVIELRCAVLASDALNDARFSASGSVRAMGLRSIMCVPLVDGQQEIVGMIQLEATGPEHFGCQDLELLAGVARHLAIVIENSRLHAEALASQRSLLEQRFQGLIEGSIQGILIHRHFKPLFVNRAWAELHGTTVDEVLRMESVLPMVAPEDRRTAERHEAFPLHGKESPTRYEARGLRKDGTEVWLEKFVKMVPWDKGPAVQVAVVDVSDRKAAEEALHAARDSLEKRVNQRTAELKRSNQDLEQFAYSVSHDLQTPLRTVTSYCQLLQSHCSSVLEKDADASVFLREAIDGARRMRQLLNDLLEFSRVTTQAHDIETADANAVLQEVLVNLQAEIEESQAAITLAELPHVACDATQLMQLFQNLIGNAIRYRSKEPLCIEIQCVERPSHWQFRVCDNGVGIEARYHDRIFQVFQRLYTEQEIPGTGIGLAICKRIVERHGGRIWLESGLGKGSTFFFTLSKRPQPNQPQPNQPELNQSELNQSELNQSELNHQSACQPDAELADTQLSNTDLSDTELTETEKHSPEND